MSQMHESLVALYAFLSLQDNFESILTLLVLSMPHIGLELHVKCLEF